MNHSHLLSLGHCNVTMASKRKMSQRQKHSKSTRGTQTEDISQVSSANTILIKNPPLRFKGLNPEEPTDVVDVVAGSNNNDGDYYDMDTRLVLYQRIETTNDNDIEVINN